MQLIFVIWGVTRILTSANLWCDRSYQVNMSGNFQNRAQSISVSESAADQFINESKKFEQEPLDE